MQGLQVPRWELYPPCLTFLLCHPKMDTFPSVGQHAGAEPEGGAQPEGGALQQAWFSGSIHKFTLSVESRHHQCLLLFPTQNLLHSPKGLDVSHVRASSALFTNSRYQQASSPSHTHNSPLCRASYSQSSEPAPA